MRRAANYGAEEARGLLAAFSSSPSSSLRPQFVGGSIVESRTDLGQKAQPSGEASAHAPSRRLNLTALTFRNLECPGSVGAARVFSNYMNLDHESQTPSIDAKAAEEALRLAVRLQHEGGERVSLEELDRTADEAGIDRAYLREALRRLQQQGQEEQSAARMLRVRVGRVFAGTMAAVVGIIVVIMARTPNWNTGAAHAELVAAAFAAMAAAVVAIKTRAFGRRRRRASEGGLERQG